MTSSPNRSRPLPRRFYRRDPVLVAPELLGKVLVHRGRAGRIVEVEAYRGSVDPASHAWRGRTTRNGTMFGSAGHLYVYFTYGMHWCANAVCELPGDAGAVLIRALVPLRGVAAMETARPTARRRVDLCNGPAKLCAALGIDGTCDGADLVRGDRSVTILDDGVPPPAPADVSPRIGVTRAADVLWRWSVPDEPAVSQPVRRESTLSEPDGTALR